MQLTSLYCYFPAWSEQEFNQKFRQAKKSQIMQYSCKVENFTDREAAKEFGDDDPNAVRPRRNELVKAGLLVEDCRRVCKVGGKLCIAWKRNQERLAAYMSAQEI